MAGLTDQARRRADMARQLGREPQYWVASQEAAEQLEVVDGHLHGLPVMIAPTRSEWGLDLILDRAGDDAGSPVYRGGLPVAKLEKVGEPASSI